MRKVNKPLTELVKRTYIVKLYHLLMELKDNLANRLIFCKVVSYSIRSDFKI